jgi:hypothetical protein
MEIEGGPNPVALKPRNTRRERGLPFNHHHHHQIDITPLAISPYFGDAGLALVMVRPSPLLRSRQRLLKRKNPAPWLHFSRDAGSKGCRVAMA